MEDLNRKLTWLMATRMMVVLSVVFASLIYSPDAQGESTPLAPLADQLARLLPFDVWGVDGEKPAVQSRESQVMQLLVGLSSLLTLIYAGLLRLLNHRPRLHAAIQVAGDLLLVSLLIYKFGGTTANLSILYFAIVAVAAFMLRGRAALKAALSAFLLYAAVVVLHQSQGFRTLWAEGGPLSVITAPERVTGGATEPSLTEQILLWLKPPDLEDVTGVPVPYNLAIHLIGLLTVAFYTSYLARNPELERELEQQSQHLETLRTFHLDVVQSISSGLLVTDRKGIIQSLNRAGQKILGVREELLQGRQISETGLFTEPTWHRLAESCSRETLRSETTVERGSDRLAIGFTLSPLRDGEDRHNGYILIFQDLTEWRALQERVRLQDRMAAVGQMAAGLAHEVGNPLAAISGSTQLLAKRLEVPPAETKLLEITVKESQRLDRTVKSFLQFAKPRDRHPESFDVAALLAEDTELLRNSSDVKSNHDIVLDLEPPSFQLVADVDQVGQLFWNLARNALQAMSGGGTLTLRGRVEGEGTDDAVYRFSVSDTGRGMGEEERAKLFQPFKSFFDSGLGLGMAICYRIVQEHGGQIHVESDLGRGTTVVVELPASGTAQDGSMTPDDSWVEQLASDGSTWPLDAGSVAAREIGSPRAPRQMELATALDARSNRVRPHGIDPVSVDRDSIDPDGVDPERVQPEDGTPEEVAR